MDAWRWIGWPFRERIVVAAVKGRTYRLGKAVDFLVRQDIAEDEVAILFKFFLHRRAFYLWQSGANWPIKNTKNVFIFKSRHGVVKVRRFACLVG